MGNAVRTIFFLSLSALCVNGEISRPWVGVFSDTTYPGVGGTSPNALLSKTQVYADYQRHSDHFKWTYRPNPTTWITPSINLQNENFGKSSDVTREWNGNLSVGRIWTPGLSGEAFFQPQRFAVISGNDDVDKRFEDSYQAGARVQWQPLSRLELGLRGNRIYSHDYDFAQWDTRNPGWGGAATGRARFAIGSEDTARISGEIIQEEQQQRSRGISHVRMVGRKRLSSRDQLHFVAKQSLGEVDDGLRGLDEGTLYRAAGLLLRNSWGPPLQTNLFWLHRQRQWDYRKTPLQDTRESGYQIAGSFSARRSLLQWHALAGIGRDKEDLLPGKTFSVHSLDSADTRRNLLDNLENRFWLESETVFFPLPWLRLEWRGYGDRRATDYDYFFVVQQDTVSSEQDYDHISLDHWVRSTFALAPACSVYWEGRYSEYILQYLKARYSGGNRVQKIYMLSPSAELLFPGAGSFRQRWEIVANYKRNPFSPSRNTLFRQLRIESEIGRHLTPKNQLFLSYDYENSDRGSLDTTNHYSIQGKAREHRWLLEWERMLFDFLLWRPGFGRIDRTARQYDFTTGTYISVHDLAGFAWVYSIKARKAPGKGRGVLRADISYVDEFSRKSYWDTNLTFYLGF